MPGMSDRVRRGRSGARTPGGWAQSPDEPEFAEPGPELDACRTPADAESSTAACSCWACSLGLPRRRTPRRRTLRCGLIGSRLLGRGPTGSSLLGCTLGGGLLCGLLLGRTLSGQTLGSGLLGCGTLGRSAALGCARRSGRTFGGRPRLDVVDDRGGADPGIRATPPRGRFITVPTLAPEPRRPTRRAAVRRVRAGRHQSSVPLPAPEAGSPFGPWRLRPQRPS